MKVIIVKKNQVIKHKALSNQEIISNNRKLYCRERYDWHIKESKRLGCYEFEVLNRALKFKRSKDKRERGIQDGAFQYYRSDRWQSKRERILSRDNYKCQECGQTNYLQVHHIKYLRFSNKDQDCITLCVFCHAKKHPINGSELLKAVK